MNIQYLIGYSEDEPMQVVGWGDLPTRCQFFADLEPETEMWFQVYGPTLYYGRINANGTLAPGGVA